MKTTGRLEFALFRVFGCALLFAVVLLTPHETFADNVTESCSPIAVEFMLFTSTVPNVQALACGQFNPALGTLQSTSVVVESTLSATLGVANHSGGIGSAGDEASVVVDITNASFSGTQINTGQFVFHSESVPSGSQPDQAFIDPSVSTTLMSGASTPFVGTGNFALGITEVVTTSSESGMESMGFAPTFFGDVELYGFAEVTYNFTTGPTSTVPEPSSLAMLSVGIIALAGFAAKKSL